MCQKTNLRNVSLISLSMLGVWLLVISCLSADALAQVPSPLRFVQSLDLKCYRIESDVASLDIPLRLDHLNPVLRQMGLPPEQVVVREPQQLCVPVAKNERVPPPDVLRFIEHVDLKCYRIESDIQSLDIPLRLDHLNPVLREMEASPEQVIVRDPQQLCVPVAKNGRIPPPDILRLIEHIDLKCYGIESDVSSLEIPLRLDHLNPLFRQMGLPPEQVIVHDQQQLCVPVAKNGQMPPPDVLRVVQFIDLKRYGIESDILSLDILLRLDHLNPLFRQMGLPPEQVIVFEPQQLSVPVTKNGQIPPPY